MKHTSWPAGLRTMFIFNYYKKHCYKNTLLYGSPWTICIFHLLYIKSLEYTFSCWPENNVYFSTIIKESSWSQPIYCIYGGPWTIFIFHRLYTLKWEHTSLPAGLKKGLFFKDYKKIVKKLITHYYTLVREHFFIFYLLYILSLEYTFSWGPVDNVYFSSMKKKSCRS